jgi:hypothetical protein
MATDDTSFWKTFSRALGADPREDLILRGASGLDHTVQAISVDDKSNRVILVSAEASPRSAALMQFDIQATMPQVHVLVARPLVVDLGSIARALFPTPEAAVIDFTALQKQKGRRKKHATDQFAEQLKAIAEPVAKTFQQISLPPLTQIMGVIQQFGYLDWKQVVEAADVGTNAPKLSFAKLREMDNMAIDREHGICPLPLYELSENDWELFKSGTRLDDARQRLKELGILQYFFPAPDQLALAVIENGLNHSNQVIEAVEMAPNIGHPWGEAELVTSLSDLPDMLSELETKSYIAEAEYGFEISPAGQTVRGTVKVRPRESLLAKLLQRFGVNLNVSVNPRDFIGGPPGGR